MNHTKTAIAGLNPETGICRYVGDQTEGSLMEAINQGLILVPVTPAQARASLGEAFVISATPVDRAAQLTSLRESGMSIDGENAYKRDLIDSIIGTMMFGFQGVNPPPEGHWGKQFWDMGRAEGEERQRLTNQRDAILLQARVWAGEAKAQQSITREVGDILGGIPSWGAIAAGVEALRAENKALDLKLAESDYSYDCDRVQFGQQLVERDALLRRVIDTGELSRVQHSELEADICEVLRPAAQPADGVKSDE